MQCWFSCNKCSLLPSIDSTCSFWLVSCGHIFCANCLNENQLSVLNNAATVCILCQKPVKIMQINSHMNSNILEMFKPTSDLLSYSVKKMKTAFEFQSLHQQRMVNNLQKKTEIGVDHARQINHELIKRREYENALRNDCNKLRIELHQSRALIDELEKRVAEKNKLVTKMHQRQHYYRNKKPDFGCSPYRENRTYKRINNLTLFEPTEETTINQQNAYLKNIQFPDVNYLDNQPRPDFNLKNLMNTPTTSDRMPSVIAPTARPFPNTPMLIGLTPPHKTLEATQKKYF